MIIAKGQKYENTRAVPRALPVPRSTLAKPPTPNAEGLLQQQIPTTESNNRKTAGGKRSATPSITPLLSASSLQHMHSDNKSANQKGPACQGSITSLEGGGFGCLDEAEAKGQGTVGKDLGAANWRSIMIQFFEATPRREKR